MATIPELLTIAIQHHQAGRLQTAEQIYRQVLQVEPNQAHAIHLLGMIAHRLGKLDQAVACCRRAVELKPDYAEAHGSLGMAFKDLGKIDEAVACYRRCLELQPGYAEGYNNLGAAYKEQGKLDDAVACCRRAVDLKPEYVEAHCNLGNVLRDQGKLDDAVACCRRALQLKPDFPVAHNNLGNALRDQDKLDEAVACYRHSLELQPDYAEAHNNLGNALKDQGNPDEAIACYRRSLELQPDYAVAHSNLLFALQYCAGITPAALAEAHAEYDHRHAASLLPPSRPISRMSRRGAGGEAGSPSAPCPDPLLPQEGAPVRPARLRLGFVSPDLGRHPVGYFLVRVLENLDQEQHDKIAYSDRIVQDDLTHRLQAAVTQWRDVSGMSDPQLAEQIRADRIDILFDLAGHTAHNRLLVFARKPAPIQVTWAGYVGTTGLKAIDYLLADRYEVPPGAESHYQERVLRMPDGYVCYDPPAYAPPVAPLPALGRGQHPHPLPLSRWARGAGVTFGCFNNPAKITPHVIEVWARILRRLPGARLVLKFAGWNQSAVARRFTEMFVAHAIDPGRLELLGRSPHAELLAEYNRIDLALDPFPYGGGLTTCEALWMGVPVITCPFETFASRHSLSHLSAMGLTETVARDLDEYVELAVSLAGDWPRLADLRAGLRPRMAASPLCDGKRFATNLSSILHSVWKQGAGNGNGS